MFLFKLRIVGGPFLWEALGHGLLGLGLKRALVSLQSPLPWELLMVEPLIVPMFVKLYILASISIMPLVAPT